MCSSPGEVYSQCYFITVLSTFKKTSLSSHVVTFKNGIYLEGNSFKINIPFSVNPLIVCPLLVQYLVTEI